MSGFDPTWLALREPADLRSRSQRLIALAAKLLNECNSPIVCDLGAGTGSATRGLSSNFPKSVHWHLVDSDADCLKVARDSLGFTVKTRVTDLESTPDPWTKDTVLVTASALFDLASAAWIESFVACLARDRLSLLACLTFDGRVILDPPDTLDDRIHTSFLLHQSKEKGLGGPACGPRAGQILVDALKRQGYQLETADTPWKLAVETDRPLMEALIDGYSQAAVETGELDHREALNWAERRKATIAALTVGHVDVFATQKDYLESLSKQVMRTSPSGKT